MAGLRVLLVEDNPPEVELFRLALEEECPGTVLVHAETAETACAMLRGSPVAFDVAVVDLMLPGDGLQFILQARDWETGATKMIVFSGATESSARDAAFRAGVHAWIEKPASLDAYFTAARQVCELIGRP